MQAGQPGEADHGVDDLLRGNRALVRFERLERCRNRRRIDERPRAAVEGHKPLLDQRGQLETSTHLVDDPFLFKFIEHEFQPPRMRYGE